MTSGAYAHRNIILVWMERKEKRRDYGDGKGFGGQREREREREVVRVPTGISD